MASNAVLKASADAAPARPVRRKQPINDLDLKNWRDYDHIETDSLWMIPERDKSGSHSAHYHGNFVPQIPRQMMERYTRQGDAVLDVFAGSGTTLIEATRAGRHGFGMELQPHMAKESMERANAEENAHGTTNYVAVGDNRSQKSAMKIRSKLAEIGKEKVQLIISHPPYHDIIKFSEDENCMSNADTTDAFNQMYGEMLDNTVPLLEDGRYMVLVIGDKYANSEWVPIGFHLMQETMARGFKLKSLVVKNMAGNRAKRNKERLWHYRALTGGFHVFKHEYVMIFEKIKPKQKRGRKAKAKTT